MDYANFDKLLDAVFVIDAEKRVHYANEVAATMTDTSVVRLKKGRPIFDFITFSDETLFEQLREDNSAGYREVSYKTKYGNEGIVQVLVDKAIGDEGWIVFVRDMTLENSLHAKYRQELEGKEALIEQLRKAQEELKKYSAGLEEMVEQRTEELNSANKFLQAMMNSLGQGLLVFNQEGVCLPNYTKACEVIFETKPHGKKFWEIVPVAEDKVSQVKTWVEGIFKEMIPFDCYAPLGPKSFFNKQGKYVELEYYCMRDDDEAIEGVVAVATDHTKAWEANAQVEREKKHAQMIIKMISNKEQFINFITDARSMVAKLQEELEQPVDEIELKRIFNALHSIKGGAGLYLMSDIEEMAHKYEDQLSTLKEMSIDQLSMALAEVKDNVNDLAVQMERFFSECRVFLGDVVVDGDKRVDISLGRLRNFSSQLAHIGVLKNIKKNFDDEFLTRPILEYFQGYEDMMQMLAQKFAKQLGEINFINGGLRVDPLYYSELFAVMVHAFRNAVDHGIEDPEERERNHKTPGGNILIEFERNRIEEKDWLFITVNDDGKGIDPDKIRSKLPSQASDEDDHQVMQHIFDSGLSTAERITDVSGRGVGMNAILEVAEQMGGIAEVFSTPGKGTRLVVKVPWVVGR